MKRKSLAWVIIALGLGLFMAMLDSTIVNISIPAMMEDFGVGIGSISWVLDAYILILAVLALTVGRLADQFGRKLVYNLGVSVFTIASLLCALSWDVNWLIAFRALQAIGAAVMISVSMAIMTASFPEEKRGTAMGIWAAVGITAAAVGPTLGGVIVEHLNWNWVFYINIPIGILAVIISMLVLDESKDPSSPRKLDLPGMVAFSISMFALVFAFIKGEEWGWSSTGIIGFFVSAAVFLVVFILWERRASEPMLNVGAFKDVTFSSSVICQALVAFGMLGAIFMLTLFLQNVLGYSALKAAVAITPIPAAALVCSPIAGRVCDKVGSRIPTVIGLVAVVLGLWFFSQLEADSDLGAVAWRAVIFGAGMGLSNPALAVAAMGAVRGGKEGVSSGVLNTSRFVGMSLGVAVCTALLTGSVTTQLVEAKAEVQTIVTENQQIPSQVKGLILEQVDHLGEGSSLQTAPDFAAIAREKGIPEAMVPQIEQATEPIVTVIRKYVTNAFNDVFPWVALITGIGIIPALLIRRPRET
ncbi:MAG: DHA2 family efflux MFS transporter permease subunit [Dehalococcoidia bacterium]|jgi:EmrB/QacA subfamily drug resistance transporter